MRLWHKELIPVLPRKQLLGQWRECCLIAKNIAEKGTPNHILVNRVNGYPIEHLWKYGYLVSDEMEKRGYKCNYMKFDKWFDNSYNFETPTNENLFRNWHNERYLAICIANLFIGFEFATSFNDKTYTVTVTDKERVNKSDSSKYLVFCEDENGAVLVFENTDELFRLKFNSSTVQGKIKQGGKYKLTVVGFRVPFLSMYQNIIKVEE